MSYGALTHVVTVECNGCITYHPWLFANRDLRFPGDLEKAMGREVKEESQEPSREASIILMPKPDKCITRKTKDKYLL